LREWTLGLSWPPSELGKQWRERLLAGDELNGLSDMPLHSLDLVCGIPLHPYTTDTGPPTRIRTSGPPSCALFEEAHRSFKVPSTTFQNNAVPFAILPLAGDTRDA
jgi:hypothetical protein